MNACFDDDKQELEEEYFSCIGNLFQLDHLCLVYLFTLSVAIMRYDHRVHLVANVYHMFAKRNDQIFEHLDKD